MHIRQANDSDRKQWDAYVKKHHEGSPFHLMAWKNAIIKSFGHPPLYFVAVEHDSICGILPLFQLKSFLFGNIITSVPFAAEGGILADNEAIFATLLDTAKAVTQDYGADYLELKFCHAKDTGLHEPGLHLAFVKEISDNHDVNMKAIPRKQRAMVRKGVKSGLQAFTSNSRIHDFYKIFSQNVHQLGSPVYPKKWFTHLLEEFGKDAEVMVIEHEGKVISGVFTLYYKEKVMPYYAGSLMEYRKFAPNDFQYWQLMCRAVERGCRFFDYGRSKKDSGHCNYKKNWGFTPEPLHYQFYLNKIDALPELNPLNPKYQRKIAIWKKLPIAVTNLIGPQIVKYIP